ncbi:MAG TPA: IS1595 family transposase [Candidatus Angelobacter sp.]|nr:IS1595 family transposase [Candidatus Angelobacter sp.]
MVAEKINLTNIAEHFADPDKAREFLEKQSWPDGPVCPHCGEVNNAYRLEPKPGSKKAVRKGVWKCGGCREQFTVTVGTIFADSHIPLNKWLMAIHLLCASKKGMSAHQIHRMLGVTYKSAWFMMHRIRYAMTQEPLSSKLTGIIEEDETYIGGKLRCGAQSVKPGERPHDRLSPVANKAAVVSVLQRNGRVQSRHVEKVTAENLKPMLREMIDENAHLMTDTSTVLKKADVCVKHDRVNHTQKEYVRYENGVCITTNAVEGYFANLKRGINGVYHFVGKQHLHRYLTEFDFRYNSRDLKDGERTVMAIQQVGGKRLMLRDSRQQAENF